MIFFVFEPFKTNDTQSAVSGLSLYYLYFTNYLFLLAENLLQIIVFVTYVIIKALKEKELERKLLLNSILVVNL